MPAWGDLVNTLQLNGLRVESAKQAVQAQGIDLQQKQEMYQLQKRYRDQELKALELNPMLSNPDTSSISESQDSKLSPEDRMVRDLTRQQAEAQRNLQMARAIDPKQEQHWITRLDNLTTNLREAQKYASQRNETRSKEIANILSGINSSDSARDALLRIADLDQEAAKKIYKSLPTDDNGDVIWNETAKKAIAPAVNQHTSIAEQELKRKNTASEAQRAENAKIRENHYKAMAAAADKRAARAAAGAADTTTPVDAQKYYDSLDDAHKKELDLQSWNYITKNILPYRKGTGGGKDENKKVLDNVGRIMSELETSGLQMAGASAEYKANAQSLYFQTKKVDAIEGTLASFHNNVDSWDSFAKGQAPKIGGERVAAIADQLKKINFIGVRSLDEVKLKLQQEFNDPTVNAYVNSAMAVAMDYARIMQGPQSVASLTEGARHDAMRLISTGLNDKARAGALASLESDAQGQVKGIKDQLDKIRSRMGMPVSPVVRAFDSPRTEPIRKALEAKGMKYEPDVYDYEIRDGKVFRAKKE